jgi:nucleoside-diphosphate-sugar epimerase
MTIFLVTGATGVVGSAVTEKLVQSGHTVYALSRNPASHQHPRLHHITGDVTREDLGLSARDRQKIRANATVVIHAAGEVAFNHTEEIYRRVNTEGTANCVKVARSIGARFVYVSTAYASRVTEPGFVDRRRAASSYAVSKHAAEHIVREYFPSAVIVRPSIVVGRSTDGHIARWQGLHHFVRNLLRGRFPFIPTEPIWTLDTIPVDHLATFVATAAEGGYSGQTLWATIGDAALPNADIVATALGSGSPLPRFVHPEIFDRLIRPAFLPELPVDVSRYIESLFEAIDQLFTTAPFPSDLTAITGITWSPADSREIIRKTALNVREVIAAQSRVKSTA